MSKPRSNGLHVNPGYRHLVAHPPIRIIGLSMYDEDGVSEAMMDAGACGYCSKSDRTAVAAIKGQAAK